MEYNLAEFKQKKFLSSQIELFFVVKSQDQLERRARMINSRSQHGGFGRVKQRETAEGLFGHMTIKDGQVNVDFQKNFKEPRHITKLDQDKFLLTEINQVHIVEKINGEILDSFTSKWFSYLHTIELNQEKDKFLVVSSGFDSVIEVELQNGKISYHWCGWEHGFNPDDEGVYLAKDVKEYQGFIKEDKKAVLINPVEYGEQGILTARRTAHPNTAVYINNDEFIVGIGRTGVLYTHNKKMNKISLLTDKLHQMNHGLRKLGNQWLVTDTTVGKVVLLDNTFNIDTIINFKELKGKPIEAKEVEWIQNTIQVSKNEFISIDSNRGLIHYNLKEKEFSIYQVNENWCIQDLYFDDKK